MLRHARMKDESFPQGNKYETENEIEKERKRGSSVPNVYLPRRTTIVCSTSATEYCTELSFFLLIS